jgi:hypothetical protein
MMSYWLIGLGAFHGLNPAMGWLFAVALGTHRRSWTQVLAALPPIALGHALLIAVVCGCRRALQSTPGKSRRRPRIDRLGRLPSALRPQAPRARRHDRRLGRTDAMVFFLMATAHGAGLMLLPAMLRLCIGS